MKTLFINETGPLVQFDGAFLHIEDLNPHVQTKWRMSRKEMALMGIKAIAAAIFMRRAG
jgi:hypothetical protein